ncbi:MAG: hypothetical protein ABEJ73_11075 [Haloplanus sp.]
MVSVSPRFGVAFVVDLVLGGALAVLAPDSARRMVIAIRHDAGTAVLWGLLVGIGLPIALVLIALTIIGLLVAIPGFLVLVVLGIVGNAVTICWIGTLLTGADDPGLKPIAAGALALSGIATVPILGHFVTTLLGFFGLGVVGRDLYTSWQG